MEKRTKENKVPGTKNEYSKNLNDVLNSENADSVVIPEHKLQVGVILKMRLQEQIGKFRGKSTKMEILNWAGNIISSTKRNKDIML